MRTVNLQDLNLELRVVHTNLWQLKYSLISHTLLCITSRRDSILFAKDNILMSTSEQSPHLVVLWRFWASSQPQCSQLCSITGAIPLSQKKMMLKPILIFDTGYADPLRRSHHFYLFFYFNFAVIKEEAWGLIHAKQGLCH